MSSSSRVRSLDAQRNVVSSTGVSDGDGRFRALVDLSPDAILIHEGGRFVYANPAAVRLLRAQGPEQILGRLSTAIVHADYRHLAEVRTQLLLQGEAVPPVDMRWLRFDGTAVDVEVSASPLAGRLGFSVQVFARDISARIEAQRQRSAAELALQEEQRRLATLIENLPGMVYRCRHDSDWTMEFVSDGCLELTGYLPEELMSSRTVSYEAITHPADRTRVRAAIDRAVRDRTRFAVDYRIIQRDGKERWVQERGRGIYDERGQVRFIEGFLTDINELRNYRDQLEHQATHDTLTGLANRSLLHDRMRQAIGYCLRHHSLLATVFLDLDNFKFINDTLGHTVGDELLKLAASRLRACVREGDTVARLGGDEFVLLLLDEPNPEAVSQAVQRILETMARPYPIADKEYAMTCSMGVSLCPQDGSDAETLLKNADAAMYRAKAQGRNAFHFFTAEINQALSERMALERDLRAALQREELTLHYQPKVSLVSGQMIGAEALVRWNHPQHGMLSPARFIPIAEETGLIVPMGEWVLRQACEQARRWREAGLDFKVLSVNLSVRQFRAPDLVQQVARLLELTGLPPAALDLELTESLVTDNAEEFIAKLRALKALGVQLSVDDFGTGYSSLSYLKQFPVDRLKLDQSFVRHIVTDKGDAAIAQAVIRLGQILELAVTAEGVETEEQLAFLRRYGCDEAQGYLFSPPLPAPAFEALWREGRLAPVEQTGFRTLPAIV
jgi:diguanylate cyclase (GGDEF)-like protein/PAS domain S-box-containing protein